VTVDPLDLSGCDLEPIHIPAFIQPHGVLLVLREPGLVVTQASENVREYFGKSTDSVLGRSIATLFAGGDVARIQEAVNSGWSVG
jgi:two-component system, chemotaxis family, sensor kinase Cph1